MADDCLTRLLDPEVQKTLFGDREVPRKAIEAVLKDIEKIKADVDAGLYKGQTYKSKVMEYIAEKQRLNEAQALLKSTNLQAIRERFKFYSQPGFEKNPVEAFKSILTKSTVLANSSNDSVSARIAARFDSYANFLMTGLEKISGNKEFVSGQIDREIMQEVHSLASGKGSGVSGNKLAEQIGSVIHNMNRIFFKDMTQAGIPIRELNGFVARQTHAISKVREAGFDNWFKDTISKLDMKKTFGVYMNDQKAIEKTMRGIYSEIVSGRYGLDSIVGDKEVGDHFIGLGATKSILDKLSESRTLHFEGPDNMFDYNAKYGDGTLAENIYKEMRRNSTSLSLLEKFGDQPQAAFEADIERMVSNLRKDGKEEQASKLLGEKHRLLTMFKEVAGVKLSPGNETIARVGANIRSLQAVSKLGNVGLRSLANFAGAAVELKNNTGQNYLQVTSGLINEWFKSLPESYRSTYGKKAANFLNDMQANNLASLGNDARADGFLNRSARFMMKYNGQDFLNESARVAMGNMIQENLADQASKNFGDLPPKMQASLLSSGIKEADWNILRTATETAEDGRVFVTPEAVSRLTEEQTSGVRGKMSHERYVRDLELKLRGSIIQAVDIATTTAGARERSALTLGTDIGTFWGEVVRLGTQFKSFTLQSMNIGKRFLNSNPDTAMLEKGILASQGKDMRSLAEWITVGTALAFGVNSLIALANDKPQPDPTKAGTWLDAMAKSGAGAMYIDFFVGEWNKYNFGQVMLGPTFGQVPDVAALVTDATSGDIKGGKFENGKFSQGVVPGTTRLIRNNIPFQQFPLIKQGFDFLQYGVIQEAISPGFKAKRELRQILKQNQGG